MPSHGVVIEKGKGGYSAFVPDLPGCIAAAETPKEVRELITEAIASHIEMMREEGLKVTRPTSICESV